MIFNRCSRSSIIVTEDATLDNHRTMQSTIVFLDDKTQNILDFNAK